MQKLFHFLRYDNTVPIILGILFLGAGSVFAATNPEAILSTTEQVLSIDNTYLVNKDLSTYSPTVQITGVTEDPDTYYVSYSFNTIALKDSVWQDVSNGEVMNVSKTDLGAYRDLGVYVTEQLKQKIGREIALLRDTQEIEKKQVSEKVVATAYGGLLGALISDSTETVPGYTPVIVAPSDDTESVNVVQPAASTPGRPAPSSAAPHIQMLGNNPARIPLRSHYVDLGATVTDDKDLNLGIYLMQNGRSVDMISIDTSTTSVTTISYSATDNDGNTTAVERAVEVYDPLFGDETGPFATTTATTTAATTTLETVDATSTSGQ